MVSQPSDIDPDTLDLLFDLTRGATDRQVETGAAHDGKITTLAGAASVILGIAALASEPNRGLTIAAVAFYFVVVAATLFGRGSTRSSGIRTFSGRSIGTRLRRRSSTPSSTDRPSPTGRTERS